MKNGFETLAEAGMKRLSMVCMTLDGQTVCLKCNRFIEGRHWRSIWFPEKPFEPGGEGRGYMYALCLQCFEELKANGELADEWLPFFEDEIKYLITAQKIPRINTKKLGKTDDELLEMLFGDGLRRRS
jgi:hypothetical protein